MVNVRVVRGASLPPARQGTARVPQVDQVYPTASGLGQDRMDLNPRAAAPASPSHPALAATFARLPNVGSGEAQVRLQPSNLDSWNARWDMLTSARTSIDASYFSLEKDVFGYAMLGALLKKRYEGVKVRVMTDAMADTFGQRGFKMPLRGRDCLQELVNHGGEAYIYNPIHARPAIAFRSLYAGLASNHDKLLVVDGRRSITGGRNIGIDYLTEPVDRKGAWRDMDLEITGAGPARGLTKAFDNELGPGSVAHPVDRDQLGNWDRKDIQLLGAYEMMDLWLNDSALSVTHKQALRADPAGRARMAATLVERALQKVQQDLPLDQRRAPSKADREQLTELATELVAQLEARGSRQTYQARRLAEHPADVKIVDQTSKAALHRTNSLAPALLKLVDASRQRIVIQNPYVVLTEDMLKAMEAAGARGVKIDIITNSPLSTDSDVTQAFFLEDWPYILARVPSARIFVATGDRKFHTKSAIADREVSFVSTYNLDLLSGNVNGEVGALVRSPELAADLLRQFNADLADPAYGFVEYRIKKNAQGRPILKDGKPIPVFGPENHLPNAVLEEYASKRKRWGHTLRNYLPLFKPLRHPARLDN